MRTTIDRPLARTSLIGYLQLGTVLTKFLLRCGLPHESVTSTYMSKYRLMCSQSFGKYLGKFRELSSGKYGDYLVCWLLRVVFGPGTIVFKMIY